LPKQLSYAAIAQYAQCLALHGLPYADWRIGFMPVALRHAGYVLGQLAPGIQYQGPSDLRRRMATASASFDNWNAACGASSQVDMGRLGRPRRPRLNDGLQGGQLVEQIDGDTAALPGQHQILDIGKPRRILSAKRHAVDDADIGSGKPLLEKAERLKFGDEPLIIIQNRNDYAGTVHGRLPYSWLQ